MFRNLLICFTSTLFGCTIQGYSGPSLPPNETSLVRISDSRIRIDGIKTVFGGSVSVLPGPHHAAAAWTNYKDYCSRSYGGVGCLHIETAHITHNCEEPFTAIAGHTYIAEIVGEDEIDIFDSTSGVQNRSYSCDVTSDEKGLTIID